MRSVALLGFLLLPLITVARSRFPQKAKLSRLPQQ